MPVSEMICSSMMAKPEWELYSEQGLLDLLCGNRDAVQFMIDISRVSHTYDDLIDRDKPVPDACIHDMVWSLLVTIPVNPFYRAHQNTLRPVLITSIMNWRASLEMERSQSDEELRIAHVTRYSLADALLLCMVLTGGHEHAARHARRARLMAQADTWANYASEHTTKEHSHADPHQV